MHLKKIAVLILSLLLGLLAGCTLFQKGPQLGVDVPLRIMPMGDSITEGLCDTSENCMPFLVFMSPTKGDGIASCQWAANKYFPNAVGYRAFLKEKITARGLKMSYVGSTSMIEGLSHEGHTGWTIDDLDYCVEHGDWLKTNLPNIILLHIGTNDANYARTPEEMAKSLQKLLEDIYRKVPDTTEVIVAQIIPARRLATSQFANANIGLNEIITPYNQLIPGVVKSLRDEKKHVTYVDMSGAIHSDADLDQMGFHPNPAASERMADIWYRQILLVTGQKP